MEHWITIQYIGSWISLTCPCLFIIIFIAPPYQILKFFVFRNEPKFWHQLEEEMIWRIGSRARPIVSRVAALRPMSMGWDQNSSHHWPPFLGISNSLLCSSRRSWPRGIPDESPTVYDSSCPMSSLGLAQQPTKGTTADGTSVANAKLDLFYQMKQRFLSFKNHKYLKEEDHFQALARDQFPKFMVIACADSRVCPSNILGFQPGEAFMIRNIANLVPPAKIGPTETNAALEFAVTNLQVEHILVVGHSSCVGVQMLMRMKDDQKSSLVESWVANGKPAKQRTKVLATNAGFDEQCSLCEKESVNLSLMNLLTYPWIEDRVRRGLLSVHGGYYDLRNCTFEKWTLDAQQSGRFSSKDAQFWT